MATTKKRTKAKANGKAPASVRSLATFDLLVTVQSTAAPKSLVKHAHSVTLYDKDYNRLFSSKVGALTIAAVRTSRRSRKLRKAAAR